MSDDPKNPPPAADPLALAELFKGGGEPWLPLLKPVIERLPNAASFIGPNRDKTIVPVRELTFQALKPNPPERWKVVIFGQTPYPRVESATGIAMFDNAFHSWQAPRFPQVASMRNMLKTALIWKHGVAETISPKEVPPLLKKHDVVPPVEWFQAILSQGVLLVDASLTRHSDDAVPVARHVDFWAPVAEAIVEAILSAKETAPPEHRGVVFAWWGAHARTLRAAVEKRAARHPSVPVRHVDHWHPAARDNRFNEGNHYKKLNDALAELGAAPIDWLPTPGWKDRLSAATETTERMGGFLKDTMELHRFYLDRLQGAKDEKLEELPAIQGVLATPRMPFGDALAPVVKLHPTLAGYVQRSRDFAAKAAGAPHAAALDEHEIAALYLYTTESVFYRQLNASLRDRDRARAAPFFAWLRLFLSALGKLKTQPDSLWRGVATDLRAQYPKGATITWWGVSSCTPKLEVARGFLGGTGRRMLFEVVPATAVSIRAFSAFTGEDEYILAPGTRLKVADVSTDKGGLTQVRLEEVAGARLVA